MAWEFKREETRFQPIPEGIHRVRIKAADKAVSAKGNDMIVLQLEVSGYSQLLFHYIVFLDAHPEITNRNLTQFFDSFKEIGEGDFNMLSWIGKVGACRVKHEEYNGDTVARVGSFIRADKQEGLPPWKDASGREVDEGGFMKVSAEDDLPEFI